MNNEERVIGIHVGDNVYEALSFVCYYVLNVQDEYLVIPERKDGMVILETPKCCLLFRTILIWDLVLLSYLLSSVQFLP